MDSFFFLLLHWLYLLCSCLRSPTSPHLYFTDTRSILSLVLMNHFHVNQLNMLTARCSFSLEFFCATNSVHLNLAVALVKCLLYTVYTFIILYDTHASGANWWGWNVACIYKEMCLFDRKLLEKCNCEFNIFANQHFLLTGSSKLCGVVHGLRP